ncbi:MAG: hypothetical protein IIA03_04115 [Proteobacteria bacterium]|jgi:hypothetical protein|nr:hypothetical protein [Methylibium sp.]MBY0366194.1 hypothetical protein [Burkholderiaceae bacterium]MCH8855426.1 hypothetical protein [Pseudomonadota bacterium]|mmetsp:Transcript_53743/g.126671  ORF Transcript_53743/g.126671 Transcript_53743/m.126671 type:complete len:178 (+) Transcript_53743:800-1333(+)
MLKLHFPRAVGAWLNRMTGPTDALDSTPADTVVHWPPTPARLLASAERQAHKCLAEALALEHPKGFLLAHVPLHKLLRVPAQHSYREWLSRTGLLTVDFALCDEHGYARAIVLMPVADDQPKQARKRERLLRVLAATELPVRPWDREWRGEPGERLRELLFPRPRGDGYFADTPHAH